MMFSRGALAIALLVAVVTQSAGFCQLRCVGGLSPSMSRGTVPTAPARHSCHTSPSARADITIGGMAEGCQHLSSVTAVVATPIAPAASVAHSTDPIVVHDSWPRPRFARHAHARFGPPISSAGTLRI